ncbi:MAG: GGDEF domain-containing protein [Chloroflexota bacterium]
MPPEHDPSPLAEGWAASSALREKDADVDWMRVDESGRYDQRYVTLNLGLRWFILVAYVSLAFSGLMPVHPLALLGSAGWICATNVLGTWYWLQRRPIHWYDRIYLYLDFISVVAGVLATANLGYPIWMAFVILMIQTVAERPFTTAIIYNFACVVAYAACAAILYAADWYTPSLGFTAVTVTILALISINLTITFDGNRRLRRVIRRLAVTDALTGLSNRRQFSYDMANPPMGASLAVIVMDVDRFKNYNDSFGHLAGDQLLVRLAASLQEAFPDALTIARYGGDEFVVLLPCVLVEEAEARADKFLTGRNNDRLPVSIGLSMWPLDHPTLDAAFAAADDSLRVAKRSNRGSAVSWSERVQLDSRL